MASASIALAIQPAQWTHTTEADFAAGLTEDTVVTNLGDVKLAMHTHVVADLSEQAGVVHDVQATRSGDLYLAVGPEGALLRQRDDQVDQVLEFPGEQVFALDLTTDGKLLVAVSAPTSRLAVLENGESKTLVELEGVRYIWDMIVDGHDAYLATGTEGKLLHVNLDPKAKDGQPQITELLDAKQNNLLCLARDQQGRLYAGSDSDGLVYRVTLKGNDQPEVFVLYDAAEPEIGALLVLDDGTVYAGTADAEQAHPGRLDEADSEAGRPEETAKADAADQPAEVPGTTPKPDPMPSDPDNQPDTDKAQSSTNNSPTPLALITPRATTTNSAHLTAPLGTRTSSLAASSDAAPQPPSDAPTPAQWDRVREVIRKRLDKARRSGTPLATNGSKRLKRQRFKAASNNEQADTTRSSSEGNAIYKITPDGFVAEVFRESVMILKLLEDPAGPGKLLVATGNEGQLFRVDPAAGETTILIDLEPQQVPVLTTDHAGRMIVATANPAALLRLAAGYTENGLFTGPVLDAQQISLWGKIDLTATTDAGTAVTVETRSGNVEDPDQAAWTPWSTAGVLEADPDSSPLAPRQLTVESPPARFLQYRLALVGDADATPVVDRVQITYVVPNLKPAITSIQAIYPNPDDSDDQPAPSLNIEWEATDPNGDDLIYDLEYQPAGSVKWLTLAESLDETSFEWDTRRVPDGRYTVRVTASDAPDNPADMARTAVRRTDPVLIDNTPPTIDRIEHHAQGRTLRITAQVRDALSPIGALSYAVDSTDQWEPALPEDLIYDSTQEAFSISIVDLAPGPHVVTLRASDSRGNARYEAILLEMN